MYMYQSLGDVGILSFHRCECLTQLLKSMSMAKLTKLTNEAILPIPISQVYIIHIVELLSINLFNVIFIKSTIQSFDDNIEL